MSSFNPSLENSPPSSLCPGVLLRLIIGFLDVQTVGASCKVVELNQGGCADDDTDLLGYEDDLVWDKDVQSLFKENLI